MKVSNRIHYCFFGITILLGLLKTSPAKSQEISSLEICQQGQLECVDLIIEEMQRRYELLAQANDPDALFALNYLRTTEVFQQTFDEIDYQDPATIILEDALFADYYFRAYDTYHIESANISPSWQITFDAAEDRSVNALGHLALGINAHIQRDLPFVLYELDSQGKPVSYEDHVRANQFLSQVNIINQLNALDTASDNIELPQIEESFQLLVQWREEAFSNYQHLQGASTESEFIEISSNIEEVSAATAQVLLKNYRLQTQTTVPESSNCLGLIIVLGLFTVSLKKAV